MTVKFGTPTSQVVAALIPGPLNYCKMQVSSFLSFVALAFPVLIAALAISDTTSHSLSAFGKRDTVSTILTDLENLATCAACEVSMNSFICRNRALDLC